ncbi:DUF6285 domain-containing protein [Pseudomonas sp. H9]|uniref:DUF6285 domain-containing protein n=1 Tax=Pseudomonas sp. H9 TaxID=483968 RepID=UPI001057780D|nr:DUF6285 domain-containing protein [Pseudomonas sp. H9]TDF84035.1 hypothetical protein E1573_09850 [Pseudomonas sp. H9]
MNPLTTCDLLACARELLLSELLPALPPQQHYEARMIANALAIAGREIEHSPACAQVQASALNSVLALQGQGPLPGVQAQVLVSEQIRQGEYDAPGAAQHSLLAALQCITEARLNINNPKALRHE